jgi:PKD repeat protein/type 1 glutamine amidotransferase
VRPARARTVLRHLRWLVPAALALALPAAGTADPPPGSSKPAYRVLVFTKTAGERHASIPAGVAAIRKLGKDANFSVEATDEAGKFDTVKQLERYRAVVFLNTTGDVLTDAQQANFEQYFHEGGGFVGIHSAIQTEPNWQFLTDLLGARATGETEAQAATVKVADRVHPAAKELPEYWTRTDRWYNFDQNVRGASHVLATVVEKPFDLQPSGATLPAIAGGTMGFDHPVAWCRDFKGGRSIYTAGGDTTGSYSEPAFETHLLGAIEWAAGVAPGDCGSTVLSNYEMKILATNPGGLGEPMGFEILPDGRILETARSGDLRLIDPAGGTSTIINHFDVYTNSEDGLQGIAIDNDFAANRWVYVYYAPTNMDPPYPATTPPGNAPTTPSADPSVWDVWKGYFQLSRFKLVEAPSPHLDLGSEQKLLKVEVNRGACCHVAGEIRFDSHNNLWMVTGDDTPAGGGNSGGFSPFNDMLTNENQTVSVSGATGGTFTLTFDGQTTAPIAFPISNADLEAKLEALANIDDVAVTGTTTRTVNFRGSLSQTNVPQMTADGSGLTGTSPTVTVATTQEGALYNVPWVDARRSAQNTNDLRGKVLRIHVEPDGSYTIPPGNLFAPGTPGTRPEIYAMGFRNPFRLNLDRDDVAYVTDYSPDSQVPENFRGPAGTGRVEIVRRPSNYGWPLCYSPKLPYYTWNFNTAQTLDSPPTPFECANPNRGPENTSRWNTGNQYGPPIAQPDIWYSYRDNNAPPGGPLGTPCFAYYNGSGATSCPQLFPELGPGGGVGPHGAVPYEFDPVNPSPTKFPAYFDGASVFAEFTRDYLREVRLDSQGNIFKINQTLNCGEQPQPFLCDTPMDIKFGRDGSLYLLTYGDGFFRANPDAKLVRFSYVKGTRAPTAVASATPSSGPAPLTVDFSSEGSSDPDPNQSITFAWDFQNDGTIDSLDPNPTFTYTAVGQYTAKLTVTNSSGKSAVATVTITVGNTAPTVTITTPVAGGFFSFGDKLPWSVSVTDPEDPSIDCTKVELTFVLVHDTHGHAEATQTGCSGVYQTDPADATHAGGYVAGALSASYTDSGGLSSTEQIVIQQKHQEAEVLTTSGTTVGFTTDGNGVQVQSIDPGDWIALGGPSLDSVNFLNMDSISFRVQAAGTAGNPRAAVELRFDAPDGPLAATIGINSTGNVYATQTTAVGYPSGTHKLYLVFRSIPGGPTTNLFNLNWFEFGGQGVGTP